MIEIRDLCYRYDVGTPFEKVAVQNVSFTIEDGAFLGIAGSTGSGKSTLIKHLNGLLRPTSGTVLLNGEDIFASTYDRIALRGKVGLVFQYPEYQLFEETVLRDVMFGPKNMGLSDKDAKQRAKDALSLVGLGKEYYKRSPFALSGGEKRRVAIAGMLAMQPQVLVLDEPAAGLDPRMHNEIFSLLKRLNEEGTTIVVVSHSMEDIAQYCTTMALMDNGRLVDFGKPAEVFAKDHVSKPFAARVAQMLGDFGCDLSGVCTIEDLVERICKEM
ncbi:MAG: energy-coupling factor transporter ATPase [Sphaerochaetaceae bacterium]|nr:energy-coupling factor transporter ATPase [Sphaerochaetaceae bacterium]